MSEVNMEIDSQLTAAVAGSSSSSSFNQQRIQPRDVVGSLIMTLDDDDDNDNNSDSDDVVVLPSVSNVELEICGPSPAKRGRVVDDFEGDEEETCLICYNPFTNSGEHRLSCLACGHIFGFSCIEKWLKSAKTCPQCNNRARLKDIRVLYTKNLHALDTAERDRAVQDLQTAKIARQQAELEIARLKLSNQTKDEEIQKFKTEVEAHKLCIARLEAIVQNTSTSNPAQMKAAIESLKSVPGSKYFTGGVSSSSGGQEILFNRLRKLEWKGEECRVATYSEWSNAFVVSHKFNKLSNSGLSKALGCYGVRIFNWADHTKCVNMPIHQKEIRDLAFNPNQTDLLLTVGMDSRAHITNIHSTLQVMSFTTEAPIWSCAFSQVDANILYVGMSNGQIASYDMRKPKEILSNINFSPGDKTPINRLHFVPPSYQESGFSACGLLVQKLTSCWFIEFQSEGEMKFHQLPFEGGFISLDFDPFSRHLLVSAKQGAKYPKPRHIACEMISSQSEFDGSSVYSCNIVNTFPGEPVAKLYRPKIFSPDDRNVYIAASLNREVKLWNLADRECKQQFYSHDTVLDYVPAKYNDEFYLNFLTNDALETFKFK